MESYSDLRLLVELIADVKVYEAASVVELKLDERLLVEFAVAGTPEAGSVVESRSDVRLLVEFTVVSKPDVRLLVKIVVVRMAFGTGSGMVTAPPEPETALLSFARHPPVAMPQRLSLLLLAQSVRQGRESKQT